MVAKVIDAKNLHRALKWGAIYTGMTIGWAVLGKATGMHDARIRYNLAFNSAVLLPSLAVYALAIREMNAAVPMTYGERLLSGLVLTVFVTVLGPLNPVISMVFVSPRFFENATRYSIESGMMTDEEALQKFNLTTFIVRGFIGGPIFGFVLSLIAALFPGSPHVADRPPIRDGAIAK